MSTSPIPKVRDDDPEDVSWALSTAATQWARGDRIEALKWLRRAAEAASESEKDARALELAKAAAELTTPSMPPPSRPAGPPPLPPLSRPAPMATPKTPPASIAPAKLAPTTPKAPAARPSTPPRASTPPRPAAGTPAKRPSVRPPPGDTPKRAASKSRPDARAHKPASDEKTDAHIVTEVTKMDHKVHASEADAWPTESMGASELDSLHNKEKEEIYGQERTRIGSPAYTPPDATPATPATPAFRASQAVHVILWRDADGKLRVAPRGTQVSAVTIEVLLVAPSSDVDLLAWLGPT